MQSQSKEVPMDKNNLADNQSMNRNSTATAAVLSSTAAATATAAVPSSTAAATATGCSQAPPGPPVNHPAITQPVVMMQDGRQVFNPWICRRLGAPPHPYTQFMPYPETLPYAPLPPAETPHYQSPYPMPYPMPYPLQGTIPPPGPNASVHSNWKFPVGQTEGYNNPYLNGPPPGYPHPGALRAPPGTFAHHQSANAPHPFLGTMAVPAATADPPSQVQQTIIEDGNKSSLTTDTEMCDSTESEKGSQGVKSKTGSGDETECGPGGGGVAQPTLASGFEPSSAQSLNQDKFLQACNLEHSFNLHHHHPHNNNSSSSSSSNTNPISPTPALGRERVENTLPERLIISGVALFRSANLNNNDTVTQKTPMEQRKNSTKGENTNSLQSKGPSKGPHLTNAAVEAILKFTGGNEQPGGVAQPTPAPTVLQPSTSSTCINESELTLNFPDNPSTILEVRKALGNNYHFSGCTSNKPPNKPVKGTKCPECLATLEAAEALIMLSQTPVGHQRDIIESVATNLTPTAQVNTQTPTSSSPMNRNARRRLKFQKRGENKHTGA